MAKHDAYDAYSAVACAQHERKIFSVEAVPYEQALMALVSKELLRHGSVSARLAFGGVVLYRGAVGEDGKHTGEVSVLGALIPDEADEGDENNLWSGAVFAD